MGVKPSAAEVKTNLYAKSLHLHHQKCAKDSTLTIIFQDDSKKSKLYEKEAWPGRKPNEKSENFGI